ncbi:MAG: flavodoxin family protein [Candidatus Sabulitectum sp.]|nr:flavodoxin family protein [Candidatus Sabulitectum sp.]
MSGLRVTAFCGSPRKGGNTETLLRKMLQGAESTGAEVVFRDLNSMSIRGCQGCDWCKENESDFCVNKDDMQTIYKDLVNSDSVIIGSPVYMFQMSAQTKAMIDRFFGLLLPGFKSKIEEKKLALVFSQGAPEDSFKDYIAATEKMLSFLKFNVTDVLVAPDCGDYGSAEGKTDLMAKAFRIGASLLD